jgi:superfamily II DNA or RNA helicase
MNQPSPDRAPAAAGHRYWQALAFANLLVNEYEAAQRAHDRAGMRERFYILAAYYRRTLSILHGALDGRREALAAAALQNLIVLQDALAKMRAAEPDVSLSTLALETNLRRRVNQDLVYRVLRDARGWLGLATVVQRFNALDVLADAREPAIAQALLGLVQTGFVIERDGRYRPTELPYVDANVDRMELGILLGPDLARQFSDAGFEGLSSILEEPDRFRERFAGATGFGGETSGLVVACAGSMARSAAAIHGARPWPHAELASSAHPRPYQRLLHAILRAHRYAGQAIEAPAGCGKTFVGMLCIEDWLRTLAPGQAVLVLVPTVTYQRQWVSELCVKAVGLRLTPHLVFAGTPGTIGAHQGAGATPTVLVLTYAALARMGSGEGRGGFDQDAIERFLQGANVRHVILDEVHKVAADPLSATADVARVFMRWLKDGSLSSVIGFSGSLNTYRSQLEALGMTLAFVLPSTELIAQGWVAPFAEFGAPFNYSERERRILALVDDYRSRLRGFLRQLDSDRTRAAFAGIPIGERMRIATMLGMYGGRRDGPALIEERMRKWESGGDLRLGEVLLLSIVQIANGWPDDQLPSAGASGREEFERLRAGLRANLPPGPSQRRLSAEGFGVTLDAAAANARNIRDVLATTVAGSYLAVREWTRQAGEGRVAVARAIIAAERREREVSGVIVFDTPAPLKWRQGMATPGYRGAGGMFAALAGDTGCVPIAALSSELYLPDGGDEPLHERIAAWILSRVVNEEQGTALFELISAGAELSEDQVELLRPAFGKAFAAYAAELANDGGGNLEGLDRLLLHPLRQFARESRLTAGNRLLAWLSTDEHHLRASVAAILDYAAIARAFRAATPVEVIRGDGTVQPTRVVPTGSGRRKQRLLELTARLVDAEDLPIDVVIVSSWARTGWNVLTPNVLIDATATRDVTAWQQLRGRAMRPRPTWSAEAQRLVHQLVSGEPMDDLPPEEAALLARVAGTGEPGLPQGRTREALAAAVMLAENKVTHIYELVSARGRRPQVNYRPRLHRWERTAAIAEKHRRQEAVRASDGELLAGPDHAPLIVAEDPRTDVPERFGERLTTELGGADARIIRGWMQAARHQQGG